MAGFTLTPNFTPFKGIVTLPKVIWQAQLIPHAGGRALIIVGREAWGKYQNEGTLCYIVSNSWSEDGAQEVMLV